MTSQGTITFSFRDGGRISRTMSDIFKKSRGSLIQKRSSEGAMPRNGKDEVSALPENARCWLRKVPSSSKHDFL